MDRDREPNGHVCVGEMEDQLYDGGSGFFLIRIYSAPDQSRSESFRMAKLGADQLQGKSFRKVKYECLRADEFRGESFRMPNL